MCMHSFVGGPVRRSSGRSGQLTLLLPPWVCKPPQLLQSLLQLLHRGPHTQSNGWLRASASVFVRLWQSLSGDSHIRLPSASSSQHPQQHLGLMTVYGMDPSSFLGFIWSVNSILDILNFGANTHLSKSTNCLCSFVTELAHSG